jgi:hypothetical protein
MKKLFVVAALLALLVSIGLAEEKQYDVPGAFSFSYGDGWTKGQRNGATGKELDWLVSATDPNASFNAVISHADFSYDDWIKRNIKSATPYRVLTSKSEFASTSGEKGYKLVWRVKASNGEDLIRQQYLFRGKGDSQVMLSGTVDVANAAKFEADFDAFAKSFTKDK